MAFRRSVTARAKFFYQQQPRVAVPLPHIDRHDNDDSRRQNYLWRRDNISGSGNLFRDRRFSIPAAYTPVFVRNMSSRGEAIGTEIMNHDAAVDLLGENAIEAAVAPVANEAAAAVMGFFPFDAVLYSIDYLHSFTGMNWWASIAVTTILIRTVLLPLEIHQMKAISKVELTWREMQETNSDMTTTECTARRQKLLEGSWLEIFITPIVAGFPLSSSFNALFNMANKMPSFKDGGAFWFTDLTTPDPSFILPVLTAFTLWRAMESYAEIFESKHERIDKKCRAVGATFALAFAALTPKALLCVWITSNLYSLAFAKVMQVSELKMMLGVHDIATPRSPPSSSEDYHLTINIIPSIEKVLPIVLVTLLTMRKMIDV